MVQNAPGLKANNNTPYIFRLIDLSLIIISLILMMHAYDINLNKDYSLLMFVTIATFLLLAESFQLYAKMRLRKFINRALNVFAVTSLTFLIVTAILFLIKEGETFSRFVIFMWYGLLIVSLIGWRVIYRTTKHKLYKEGKNLRKVAIIGLNPTARTLYKEITSYPELGLEFIGYFDDREAHRLNGNLDDLKGTVDDALKLSQCGELDSVYICIPLTAETRIARIIHQLSDSTVNVFMVPDFLLSTLMQGNVGSLGSMDTISVFESPISGSQEFYKRSFDLIFSLAVLILLSPVLIVIAFMIKATSKGPVLFKQDRYGLDGKPIGVYKFRSMKVMENSDKVVQATKNDSRITPIGNFLRKTSLDELPQFFNVIKGEMSVVGPRPHAVAHNEEYRKQVDYYMLRHKVKPGITGWAQINGWRGETDTVDKMEKRVEYDLQYIRHWTLWWDIKIVFLTIFKGFISKNAY